MKPELEVLSLKTQNKSLKYFEVDVPVFKPYWHYHPELELTLITKGTGTRFVGNSIEAYQTGDLVLIGQNLPHHWVSSENPSEQGAIVIQFPPTAFQSFPECNLFNNFFKEAQAGLCFSQPKEHFLAIFKRLGSSTAIGQIGLVMHLLELLKNDPSKRPLSSLTYVTNQQHERDQTKVSKTITYILEHRNEQLSVGHMSTVVHMVPQSFCRWFRKSVGISFITFLNSSRVENACHELITTDRLIEEIAHNNGFESMSHFIRTFKKAKNQSPSQFRKNWQNRS